MLVFKLEFASCLLNSISRSVGLNSNKFLLSEETRSSESLCFALSSLFNTTTILRGDRPQVTETIASLIPCSILCFVLSPLSANALPNDSVQAVRKQLDSSTLFRGVNVNYVRGFGTGDLPTIWRPNRLT
jgi:hypothetical protein